MKLLTLIPNANSYGIVTLLLMCVSSTAIASFFHLRYLSTWHFNAVFTNALIKGFIFIYGCLIIPLSYFFTKSLINILASIIVGILLGILTAHADKKIIRFFYRHPLFNAKNNQINLGHDDIYIDKIQSISNNLAGVDRANNNALAMFSKMSIYAKPLNINKYGITSVIFVALFEEFLFRGYLLYACLSITNFSMKSLAVILTTLIFGLMHIDFGWEQVIAKTILSIITTLTVLFSGNIIAALIIHCFLNIMAYIESKRHPNQSFIFEKESFLFQTGSKSK